MKSVLCILASLCVLAQAVSQTDEVADKNFLIKQKAIYELFWHVDQPTIYHSELYQKARTFNIAENVNSFTDKEAITEFLELLKHGMLPRGEIFTPINPELNHQAVILFRVLHSAQDFDTFYNTAVWARFHVNELMYVYCLSVAVLHRPDTRFIKLPPLQEVVPHFYFNDDVMHKAYTIAMGDVGAGIKKSVSGVDYFVVPTNYTGWYLTKENIPEQKLSYFTEDVGLNAFHFFMNHNYPSFMSGKTYKLPTFDRGEHFFYTHKQLLTRYYLERLANDLGEIDYVTLDRPIEKGFYPMMHHSNGLSFPQREVDAVVPLRMSKHVQALKDLHTRISHAIDFGYVKDRLGSNIDIYGQNGLNYLGNIVEGNADTINPRLYGNMITLVKKIFGFSLDSHLKYHAAPSALEFFSTCLRDPVYFSIQKTILDYYMRYKENLPRYKQEDLLFPGVKIETVNVDKLKTYFDNFESMLNNGLSVRSHKEAKTILIKARQRRLNHKPFTYHIAVTSAKHTKAVVRVFLGPKYDVHGHELELQDNFMNFLEMDQWTVTLKSGMNNIERSSHESIYVVPDEVPSDVFYKKVVASIEGTDTFTYSTRPYGFPDRLILPRGKKEGMLYKLFVVISPFDETKVTHVETSAWGRLTYDGHSTGFPLDRPIDPVQFFVPNIYMKDVQVFHKEMEELNVPSEFP